jgi:chorismate mutase
MANLHDVSWGNRPSSTGTEAFTSAKKDQEKIKGDYMIYRMNFMFVWLVLNIAYFWMIVYLVTLASINTQWNALTVYALSIAALVSFKVLFATLYILWWRVYKQYQPRFQERIDLVKEVAECKLRAYTEINDSEIERELEVLLESDELHFQPSDIEEAEDILRQTFKAVGRMSLK